MTDDPILAFIRDNFPPNPDDPALIPTEDLTPAEQTRPDGPRELDPATMSPERVELYDQAVARWHDARAALEKATTAKKDEDAYLLTLFRPGEEWRVTYAPAVGVRVKQPSRSYDPDTAAELYVDKWHVIPKTRDDAAIRKILKGAGREDEAMRPGTGSGSVVAL